MVGGNYVNRFNLERPLLRGHPAGAARRPADAGEPRPILCDHGVRASRCRSRPWCTIETDTAPNALTQYNQLNSATFSAVPMPGVTMGQAVDFLEQQAKKLLPADFQHAYLSDSRQYVTEGNQLAVTFVFALIVIFLVLAAQFESLRDPFVILVSVPMSICGALLPLFFGLATMNIYTQIGLVTLIGLISKHGILMVEFANELQRNENLDRRRAIERAARVRLRPILMTTAAMVVGLVPLLAASGAGAASRFSIGLVDRRRHVDRHAVHPVRAAGRLHRAGQRPPRRRALDPVARTGASLLRTLDRCNDRNQRHGACDFDGQRMGAMPSLL